MENNLSPTLDFESIWQRYPRKVGKQDAIRFFKKSVSTPSDWLEINKALDNYCKSDRVAKGFIQDGSRWFRNWRDWAEISEVQQKQNDRAIRWAATGLSICHGSTIFIDDDGKRRCASCITVQ